MLRVASRPLFSSVTHVDEGGMVGPGWSFFFLLSSLSHSLEIRA